MNNGFESGNIGMNINKMSTTTLTNQIKEEHLTCTICLNNFIKPKALPCLHTYCELCLYDYIVSRGYDSEGIFPCPTCRADTKMPANGVEGFPNNHLMSSLSDTVENASHMRPVPKPRKSLGVTQPVPEKEQDLNLDDGNSKLSKGNQIQSTHPSPNNSLTNKHLDLEGSSNLSKVCSNDIDLDWTVGPRQMPTAPGASEDSCKSKTKDVSQNFGVSSLPKSDHTSGSSNPSIGLYPAHSPPHYQPEDHIYSNEHIYSNIGNISAQPPIGWNMPVLESSHPGPIVSNAAGHSVCNDNVKFFPPQPSSDSQIRHTNVPRSSPLLYPTVPHSIEHSSAACTKNMILRFGKQGSTVRDFLKPIGLSVSHDEKYIVSDNAGDQNRIFIFSNNGELTTAFNCGCKVKDVAISKKNEILAAVHKNVAAIRHFTMSGQCKGEYGKFFTYEEPCGISELSNGGVALTGTQNHCVYILTNQMKLSTKFGRKGNGDGYFQNPGFLTVDSKDHVIVTDKINNSVQVFESDGKFKHRFGSTGSNHGQLKVPMGVCVDNADNIIVADSENNRVECFSPKGSWIGTVVQNTLELGESVKPINVAFTPSGRVAVLLRGPYFAEVRVYHSDHKKNVPQEGIRKKK
uniref:RING-type domain-containing protein n=1 Tax=Biomphalaria glabrata TaxID=6526 RepID=A0A2C9JZ53_BIOGL